MLKKTIVTVVNWMGAAMRPSFFVLAVLFAISACSPAPDTSTPEEQSGVATPSSDVTIYRDKYGTPHVVADSNRGVYFGYGYAVATDRLFQMEMLRRTVEGRVAEVLGEKYLELDKHIRTAYDHRAVTQQLKNLNEQDREVLEAYADGFSQRVATVLENKKELLPKEFIDNDFLPQTWTAYDVAMIFIGSIVHRYSDFNSELDSLGLLNSLAEQHGEAKAKKIYDASKWLTDPSSPTTVPRTQSNTMESAASAASKPNSNQLNGIDLLSDAYTKRVVLDEQGRFFGTTHNDEARLLHQQQIAEQGFTGPEYNAASNFWSVTGSKLSDADGALVNGPQFDFGLPSYVYGIGLHGGDFNVVGNTLLGLPTMLFGHNNRVSWGSTAGMSDQVDVYRERLVEAKPEHYRHADKDKPFETWNEVILVRDAEPVEVLARRTVHGMVVAMDETNQIAYSRARAWEGAEVDTLVAWVNLAKDKSLDGVQTRLSKVAANINFYYMDVDGNLGYTHGGRYPQRTADHDSRVPADGMGDYDWIGYRPYTDNPNVRNPEQGYIVNWNNRPGEGWLASDLWTYTWSKGDRVKHIISELTASEQMSAEQVWSIAERVSYDDVSAAFLLPYLQAAQSSAEMDAATSQAMVILNNWNREWRPNGDGVYGAAELIIESWTNALFAQVIKDDIGEDKFAMYAATNNPNKPLGASMSTSVGIKVLLRNLDALESGADSYDFFNGANAKQVLRNTFSDAVAGLVERHGDDMTSWTLTPAPMTWKPFNFRGVPQASEDALVSLPAYLNRGSENNFFIARNGEFEAYDVIPPGQSGFIAPDGKDSEHTRDQMDLYSSFDYKTIPFSLKDIQEISVSTENINIDSLGTNSLVKDMKSTLAKAEEKKHLGAFIHLDSSSALLAAGKAQKALDSGHKVGVLHGVPIVVKDNTHVAGMPNSAGTLALKNFIPAENNPAVQRLIDAGAIILGKTNMHELAFGITSNNAAFGAVRNAHNPTRIAGGSSGGTAVAVAAGIVEMGIGTDTGGSTRIPPALNGVVGFRPSMGRYPAGGVTPISSTRDTVGPITNNVENAALLDCVMSACDGALPKISLKGLKFGVPRDYFYANLSPAVAQAMQHSLDLLVAAGVELVEVKMPGLEQANNSVGFPIVFHEFMQEMPQYLKKYNTGVSFQQMADAIASPDVKGTVQAMVGAQENSERGYREAMDVIRPQLQEIYEQTFATHNLAALVMPTTPLTATPIATSDQTVELNGEQVPTFPAFIRNTDPASNAGIPSLSIPIKNSVDGMPIGLMLDGPVDSDRQLLAIGLAVEQLLKGN